MPSPGLDALPVTTEQRQMLERYGFDAEAFASLRTQLAAGRFPASRNEVSATLSPPEPTDVLPWPEEGSQQAAEVRKLGHEAIARGEVAVAILNGGMATRFGGVVKGVVEVTQGQSFLALKLRDVCRQPGRVPVFLLNSFATEKDTAAHLKASATHGLDPAQIVALTQSISLRLRPNGELFVDAAGAPSFFAPGHGDLLAAVANSPAFADFVHRGGKYLVISNVDNLAATISPIVVGSHIRAGRAMTVEVAPKALKDSGGAPVRVDGKLQVLEGFRFPADFDQSVLPVFNTNTFVLDCAVVRNDYPLTWFRADKKVGDAPVVQFERLVGELTAFVEASYLEVPRTGPACRFLPVKAPQDLEAIVPWVKSALLGSG